ncbi:MAG: nucleotidyltransferase family protein [Spiribacter sp.]|nr:nucleotidyltransferase family protein [Spiribacter sp.]MDR9489532.1 nucleotidyltransferase family protein [Spiribacter sp.]
MNAMILAAGRGERMRPLTDHCPKVLLSAGGKTLLDWHLQRLVAAGVERVVINIAWLGDLIREHLRHHTPMGLEVLISDEQDRALETAGGIVKALPLLGSAPFLVLNGDVWCDFKVDNLPSWPEGLAHLLLVNNPAHHPQGDFSLIGDQVQSIGHGRSLTYAGIGCFHPELFAGQSAGVAALGPLLRRACGRRQLTATHYSGYWQDVGTPARLAALDVGLTSG